jgi:hypothetical protein
VIPVDDAQQAAEAVPLFRLYPKLLGWLVLHAAGLPTLPGLIVTEWNPAVARAATRFADRWPSQELLVRSDSPVETGRSPRGGYLVALAELEPEARLLLEKGRAVFLLEPASPFDDAYSISCEPDVTWRHWLLEIVGPGFDASDLKRGDVTPHEQVRLTVEAGEIRVIDRMVASAELQATARAIRLEKIARLLACTPAKVDHKLRQRGETMLLDEATYPPIPLELIEVAVQHAVRLEPELKRHDLSAEPVMLSLSFIGRRARPVFWDVMWPRARYSASIGTHPLEAAK